MSVNYLRITNAFKKQGLKEYWLQNETLRTDFKWLTSSINKSTKNSSIIVQSVVHKYNITTLSGFCFSNILFLIWYDKIFSIRDGF